jgi:hypothetical protein
MFINKRFLITRNNQKLVNKSYSSIRTHVNTAANPKTDLVNKDLKESITKLNQLVPYVKTEYFDVSTLNRLSTCSNEFITNIIKNLNDYGIKDKELAFSLKNYEDWSMLDRKNLHELSNMFRKLSLNSSIFSTVMSGNSNLLQFEEKFLTHRIFDLKNFFTNKHLERILPRSPQLLTDNFDSFKYKFIYMYELMGVRQNDMCSSYVFNKSMKHLRERHLFLARSFFYDKPTKKGLTRVENPKLNQIVDTSLKEFLKKCTNNLFDEHDYQSFCEYLSDEFVDNELLGNKLDREIRNKILATVRHEKHLNYLKNSEGDDD